MMNSSDTFKLPEGRFDSIGWLAFATAYTANGFLDKLRALMHENAALTERCAALRASQESTAETHRAEIAELQGHLKTANERNAEKILKKKR